MKYSLLLFLTVVGFHMKAQTVVCEAQDRVLMDSVFAKAKRENWKDLPSAQLMDTLAVQFLGTPYVSKTLEATGGEKLVVNFTGVDCTTFMETVLALAVVIKKDQADYQSYVNIIESIRYREGIMRGYASRLHYLSEWIRDNEQKGYITDMTKRLKGIYYPKHINFMSTHRSSYKQLEHDSVYQSIKTVEDSNNTHRLVYIPTGHIKAIEHVLHAGDIVGITTTIKGLDVVHVGLVHRVGKRVHLLHASSDKKKVVVSKLPLVDYLNAHKIQTGVFIARLKTVL